MASKVQQIVRLRFKSYDHRALDKFLKQLVDLLVKENAKISGPIPLPTEFKRYTVNRSSFIYKDSREQFEMRIHKRILNIINPNQKLLALLNNLELPLGIEVEIKIL